MTNDITPFGHDNSFRDIMSSFFNNRIWPTFDENISSFSQLMPKVDISETDTEVQVVADIPGYNSKDIDVDIHNGILTISGSQAKEKEDTKKKFYRYERHSGSFSRSFTLPSEVNEEDVDADFKNGTLSITFQKLHKKDKKKIAIKDKN